MVKEYKFKVKQWLTKPDFTKNNPIPGRIMFGYIERETAKAYLVHLKAKPHPTTVCMRCGRQLTHKVSLLYGLGPECSGMWYEHPFTEDQIDQHIEALKEKLATITWSGWVPKSGVEEIEETGLEIVEFAKKDDKPESNSNKREQTKSQPATQPKNEEKPKPKYTLEVTDKLIDSLFKELERNL